jgi:hypothetical protein
MLIEIPAIKEESSDVVFEVVEGQVHAGMGGLL